MNKAPIQIIDKKTFRLLTGFLFMVAIDWGIVHFLISEWSVVGQVGAIFAILIQAAIVINFSDYAPNESIDLDFRTKEQKETQVIENRLQIIEAKKFEITMQAMEGNINPQEAQQFLDLADVYTESVLQLPEQKLLS